MIEELTPRDHERLFPLGALISHASRPGGFNKLAMCDVELDTCHLLASPTCPELAGRLPPLICMREAFVIEIASQLRQATLPGDWAVACAVKEMSEAALAAFDGFVASADNEDDGSDLEWASQIGVINRRFISWKDPIPRLFDVGKCCRCDKVIETPLSVATINAAMVAMQVYRLVSGMLRAQKRTVYSQ